MTLSKIVGFVALIFVHSVHAQQSPDNRNSLYYQKQLGTEQSTEIVTSDMPSNNAQAQIEEAAEQFDSFALLMPKVLNAKLQAFLKHGFKAFLLEDPQTKPAEEKMVQSLTGGLRSIGNAFEDDMANYERVRKGDGENSQSFESEYHRSSPPTQVRSPRH